MIIDLVVALETISFAININGNQLKILKEVLKA
jgi:hypothetical protein